ncbi:5'-nucleotidase C-terminal domain-containing protein [Isoptericola sp. S6320L]|uniref:5'-nucleotidase C-terminal domain-containing protein n=1 Tax=Isoptericola sp. S6320L TaxID=2926411 RepID=UPI001FF28E27|nr:5'-nucleotidase C-terminal domain-containing protein [Isoptericola sp. S6320L]MCK0117541.1 5'-nucleotidase C-terminal domain-containing protein [Isoptericola sp. S6320L]
MHTTRKQVAGATTLGLALAGVVTVGALPAQAADPVDIQILATNDFHGRILEDSFNGSAGAAVLAGAVQELRGENPNTVFAAAGDLIGASTFESFIQQDKPTIDALNAAGLDVSAVGNHELDGGYSDLVDRVLGDFDPETNPYGGAEWEYVAANLKMRATGDDAVPASYISSQGGVEIGFVGAVTEDLPFLVSPSGIEDIEVTDIVDSANAEADALRAEGVDVVVLLVHEGATSSDCASVTDGAFGEIVTGLDGDVDAIVSGHTHLEYDCRVPVAEWAGEAVTERPVVSAGQYGVNLNQLVYTVDPDTGDVLGLETDVLPLLGNYPADPEVQQIVDDAEDVAAELGAEPLGEVAGVHNRAQRWGVDSETGDEVLVENRGGESTLGNLVAEVQQWATETEEAGSAQIAFMNPGGLRADLTGDPESELPRTLTYQQAAVVQPFANTLVNMQLTGEQIKTALEQQWQRDAAGNVPSRPFLRLGVSEGFTYTYDPALAEGDRITGMWLDGEAIDLDASYSVTVNSFLAAGGDNFRVFAEGADARDTGKIDLTAFVDYMAEQATDEPLEVDASQRAVGVSFSKNEALKAGKKTAFDVSSWSMSTAADVTDEELVVELDGEEIGRFAVDSTVGSEAFDEVGTAAVELTLPKKQAGTLTLVGSSTGTEVVVGEVEAQGGKPEWTPGSVYTAGDQVTLDGRLFEAMWWTTETPGASPWGSWQEIAATSDGTAVWTSSRVFTAGDVVEHDGATYEAQWWTRNQEPGGSPWGPWQLAG